MRVGSRTARREELRGIFSGVAEGHPGASVVRGASWLYHVPAYRRLFPGAFVDNLRSVEHLHRFAALWGQFLDRFGVAKPRSRDAFTPAVAAVEPMDELSGCFAHDVLATSCDIGAIHAEFGIARARFEVVGPPGHTKRHALKNRQESILRVKGLLDVVDGPGPVVLNGVQHVMHPPQHLDAWPEEDHRSRLVFIARDVSAGEILASLEAFRGIVGAGPLLLEADVPV